MALFTYNDGDVNSNTVLDFYNAFIASSYSAISSYNGLVVRYNDVIVKYNDMNVLYNDMIVGFFFAMEAHNGVIFIAYTLLYICNKLLCHVVPCT